MLPIPGCSTTTTCKRRRGCVRRTLAANLAVILILGLLVPTVVTAGESSTDRAFSPRHWRHKRHQERLSKSGAKVRIDFEHDDVQPRSSFDNYLFEPPSTLQQQQQQRQQQQQQQRQPRNEAKPARGFVVVHDDPLHLQSLRLLLEFASDLGVEETARDEIPLYGDLPRWNKEHAERHWNFKCGWPDSAADRHDRGLTSCLKTPIAHRTSAPRVNDFPVVGFGLDLNLLQYKTGTHKKQEKEEEEQKTQLGVDPQFVRDFPMTSVRVIAMVPADPGHLVWSTLTQVHHGSSMSITTHTPGREMGIARSLYAKTMAEDGDLGAFIRDRHLHTICSPHTAPETLIRLLQRQEQNHRRLTEAVARLRELGAKVLEIDPQFHLVRQPPHQTLAQIRAFLRGECNGADCNSTAVVPDTAAPIHSITKRRDRQQAQQRARTLIAKFITVPRQIVSDCKETLEAGRVRLAVEVGRPAANLIHHIDHILHRFGSGSSKTSAPITRPGRH